MFICLVRYRGDVYKERAVNNEDDCEGRCRCRPRLRYRLFSYILLVFHRQNPPPFVLSRAAIVIKLFFYYTQLTWSSVLSWTRRSFVGPMTWNSLSADLRDPTCSDESFRRSLKTFLFAKYYCVQHIRGFATRCAI